MYEKEEQKLQELKIQMESIIVPDAKVTDSILKGFEQAKKKKKRVALRNWSYFTAAIVLLSFIGLIRVSPTIAKAMSTIPGAEKIIDLIRDDKGIQTAVENDYLQSVNVSQEIAGVKVTVESVIVDEKNMVVFYKVEGNDVEKVDITGIPKLIVAGKEREEVAIHWGAPDEKQTSKIEFAFNEPLGNQDVILSFNIEKNEQEVGEFTFPLGIDHTIYQDEHKTIAINQTVTVDNHRITFKQVDIYPLSMRINVIYDKNNSKEVFDLHKLRLVDENGEIWGRRINGTISSEISEYEDSIYLESNYFSTPEKIFLAFDGIHALDKEDLIVEVNEQTGQLLKAPKDGRILSSKKESKDQIAFEIVNKDKQHHYDFFSEITDANGNDITGGTSSTQSTGTDDIQINTVSYLSEKVKKGPLQFKFALYPLTFKEKVKIQIK